VSTESAGPVSTHLELLPAGGHPSVGGPGVLGSADPLLVGVSTLGYPSEHADPIDSAFGGEFVPTSLASSAEITTTAGTADTAATAEATSRQPPTATEVTAAAPTSPTLDQQLDFSLQVDYAVGKAKRSEQRRKWVALLMVQEVYRWILVYSYTSR